MMKNLILFLGIFTLFIGCSGDDGGGSDVDPNPSGELTLSYVRHGGIALSNNAQLDLANEFIFTFNKQVFPNISHFSLTNNSQNIAFSLNQGSTDKELILTPNNPLEEGETYTLSISNNFTAEDGSAFNGASYTFTINQENLELTEAQINGEDLNLSELNSELLLSPEFTFTFSEAITAAQLQANLSFNPTIDFTVTQVDATTLKVIPNNALEYWKAYSLTISSNLGNAIDRDFNTHNYQLFTTFDDTDKFPVISDTELLTKIQQQTFKYFWDFAHPASGMARERNTSGSTVTTGGTGFGLMAMVAAVERGFITRNEAVTRWQTIVNFLETANRFHGAWPHWLNGDTGSVQPFSANDNGADLVETAFLVQGLLTVKQYLNAGNAQENQLKNQIDQLWREVEWTWFTKGGENVLYWHWSPSNGWAINLKIQGHNETQIVYVLAAASPTYPISSDVYAQGYARNGNMVNGNSYYGINLPLGNAYGGPLFFSHYSYLGLDPRNLQDSYANYWTQNVNHSLINYEYCADNPSNYIGYSENCWGLTASDNYEGYSAHSPTNDLGVITPTAAISSLPYTPTESMKAIRFFYYKIGDRIWGDYGFVDAFSPKEEWYANSYLAIDQGPQIVMIENYRTQLLWNLFMQDTDVQAGLDLLNFTY